MNFRIAPHNHTASRAEVLARENSTSYDMLRRYAERAGEVECVGGAAASPSAS